jgi:hypothetical protein
VSWSACRLWQSHYTERWQEVSRSKRTDRWQVHYGAKQQQLGSYRGCFQHDRLSGHAGAVRCVALQPAHNLLVTGKFRAFAACGSVAV